MTDPPTDGDRLARLEQRLAALEDEQAIARLIASYGPLVDSGSASEVAALWEPHGEYDVDGLRMTADTAIGAMVRGDHHQAIIADGSAHFLGPHQITVDGDTAVAVGHSLLVRCKDARFVIARASANHWRLRRGTQGWRVVRRTTRVLDGGHEPRALLALAAAASGTIPADPGKEGDAR
ncbi:nuclear transport factor 2 family protein [Streptomyces sp. NPDC002787]